MRMEAGGALRGSVKHITHFMVLENYYNYGIHITLRLCVLPPLQYSLQQSSFLNFKHSPQDRNSLLYNSLCLFSILGS